MSEKKVNDNDVETIKKMLHRYLTISAEEIDVSLICNVANLFSLVMMLRSAIINHSGNLDVSRVEGSAQ